MIAVTRDFFDKNKLYLKSGVNNQASKEKLSPGSPFDRMLVPSSSGTLPFTSAT